MGLLPVDAMGDTSKVINVIAKRQKALGENLANADTPGYVRRDVNFGQYLNTTGSGMLEAKLDDKFGPSPSMDDTTGGTVNPANEIMELQKNSILYTMATRRMSNIITEMKTVINVGK